MYLMAPCTSFAYQAISIKHPHLWQSLCILHSHKMFTQVGPISAAVSCSIQSKAISSNFYMDDLLSGAESVPECIKLQKKVHRTLAEAGFVLRKYQCNSKAVLATLEPQLCSPTDNSGLLSEAYTSVLGISWKSQTDKF